jgi:hypothetical protein
MRPLERSLEKLDDVRKKKLSEMIAGSGGGDQAGTSSVTVQSSVGSTATGVRFYLYLQGQIIFSSIKRFLFPF